MAKQDNIKFTGQIVENLSNDKFRIELDNGQEVVAYPGGRMRQHYIRLLVGDRVEVEVSPYDPAKGIIRYRYK